jgi:hypothetical protein
MDRKQWQLGRRTTVALVLLAIALDGLVPRGSVAAADHRVAPKSGGGFAPPTALGTFEATVRTGPDAGLGMQGILELGRDKYSALLVRHQGPAVPVTGQVDGLVVNLIFYLGRGQHVFGAGTAGRDPGTKRWFMGGTFVGPHPADSGAWQMLSRGRTNGTHG